MISKRCDYSLLLDNLKIIVDNYSYDSIGQIIDKNGKVYDDERIATDLMFYYQYAMAFNRLDSEDEVDDTICNDKKFANCVLTSYGIFNSFINNCAAEFRIFEDIGTGKITYAPYQQLADFFFENEIRKGILMDYLTCELSMLFYKNYSFVRVK